MNENVRAHGIRALSDRESEIVRKAAEGHSDKQICAALVISPGTLGTYWSRIRQKSGMRWRTEIVAEWVRNQAVIESDSVPHGISFEDVLNSIAMCLSVMDGRGVVNYGNGFFYQEMAAIGVTPEDGEMVIDNYVRFEDGSSLSDRLSEASNIRAVARIVGNDESERQCLVRAWRIRGAKDQFVALWEPMSPHAAVDV